MGNTKHNVPIKNWNLEDRPREKLLNKGSKSLSDAEILAILIGSGNREETALGLSRRILASLDNCLLELGRQDVTQLQAFKGIGEAKAVNIVAAMELGKRRKDKTMKINEKISSSLSAHELLQPLIGDLSHEEFWIVYLNNSNRIIKKKQLSKGGITGTLVDIRLVYKEALQLGAVAIIVAHNHPSGTLKPSEADNKLTQKLKRAGDNLDIKLLDHLIITEKSYFSYADENLL